jgi:rare lipoprotein A
MPHYGAYKANPYTVLGKTYYPIQDARNYRATGTASWYGTKFHGQATANGETYDLYGMTAAHKTLPLPSYVRVTSLDNGRSVVLRVNDRGPFYSDRVIDLSFAAAKKLGYAETGTARVTVEGIDPAQWWAQQGRPMPASDKGLAPASPAVASQSVERYTPPPQQHAAPVQPAQVARQTTAADAIAGLYVQVGAFANPDAAELLKDKLSQTTRAPVFIDSVVRDQQTLHRVRLGPIQTQDEARQLQDSLRLANLGQPTLVKPD